MPEIRRLRLGSVVRTDGRLSVTPSPGSGAVPSLVDYGRFKYGCGRTAATFAGLLAERYRAATTAADRRRPHLVCSTGFASAPTAAWSLVGPFARELRRGPADVLTVRVHRSGLCPVDYATLGPAERAEEMGRTRLRLDRLPIPGSRVVVLDDARITGLHAEAVTALFAGLDVVVWELCLLEATDADDPQIEADLNAGYVDGIDRLVELAGEPRFALNARACRFVLADPARAAAFARDAPRAVTARILRHSVEDGLVGFPAYAAGHAALADAHALFTEGAATIG